MNKSNLNLKENPTLTDFQEYVENMVKERSFDSETLPEMFMLLMEECGELAKSARKVSAVKTDEASKKYNPAHEMADVFIYLLDICNHLGIDLEKAFREKEDINKQREWN